MAPLAADLTGTTDLTGVTCGPLVTETQGKYRLEQIEIKIDYDKWLKLVSFLGFDPDEGWLACESETEPAVAAQRFEMSRVVFVGA